MESAGEKLTPPLMLISVNHNDEIYFNDSPIILEHRRQALRQIIDPQRDVLLIDNVESPLKLTISVLGFCRKLRFLYVSLQTR